VRISNERVSNGKVVSNRQVSPPTHTPPYTPLAPHLGMIRSLIDSLSPRYDQVANGLLSTVGEVGEHEWKEHSRTLVEVGRPWLGKWGLGREGLERGGWKGRVGKGGLGKGVSARVRMQ
jgi:hypothetical protein